MKLIEKKCPNCGASLEFSETDKSCKCSYCHRSFEIERDQNTIESNDLSQQYVLNEVAKGFTFVHLIFVPVFIIIFAIFGFIFFNIINNNHNMFDKKTVYLSDVSEIKNDDYKEIDVDASMKIMSNTATNGYTNFGDKRREKTYVAYKKEGNFIIVVYKTNYYYFPNENQLIPVYIPIVYENVNKNEFVDKFSNPQLKAPEYYFDEEKKAYTYGYGSIDELFNDIIKPLKTDGYKISEK